MKRGALLLLVLLVLPACPTETPKPSASRSPTTFSLPRPNAFGRDILVKDPGKAGARSSPTIVPAKPLDLVIDDCDGFKWFEGSELIEDREAGLLTIKWMDPGVRKNRSLRIFVLSPSCRNHERVVHFFYYNSSDIPRPNLRGRAIRLVRDHGEDHPAPEILPRKPLKMVVEDCEGLDLFSVDDQTSNQTDGILTLSWADPGVGGESRSLTILVYSPSCRRFELELFQN